MLILVFSQIVPYLICMSTDCEKIVSHSADKQLLEIEKKYPGFIHTKSSLGVRLSYELQRILQGEEIVRGFRIREQGEYPGALNGYLYSILRNSRQQRRALVLNILKQFDDQAVSEPLTAIQHSLICFNCSVLACPICCTWLIIWLIFRIWCKMSRCSSFITSTL